MILHGFADPQTTVDVDCAIMEIVYLAANGTLLGDVDDPQNNQ